MSMIVFQANLNQQLQIILPTKILTPLKSLEKKLSQQTIDKYKPTKVTSETISGELSSVVAAYRYFYFMAMPGEITVTLSVEATVNSSFSGVQAVFFDPNEISIAGERTLGSATGASADGRTTQNIQKITIPEKMPVLVRIEDMSSGRGKYTIQLDGAIESEK